MKEFLFKHFEKIKLRDGEQTRHTLQVPFPGFRIVVQTKGLIFLLLSLVKALGLAGFAFQKALSSSQKGERIWLSGFAAGWACGKEGPGFSTLGFLTSERIAIRC